MSTILTQFRSTVVVLVVIVVLTGVVFPVALLGLSQVLFHDQANGSLIERDGQTVGSSLIGQSFVDPESRMTLPGYFRGRPSAAGEGYDASFSSGSNLAPLNPVLAERVANEVAIVREENGLDSNAEIPVDLVTASGSGLDPHISPAAAELQVARVAAQRSLAEDRVRDLVADHTEGRMFGFIGEPRVNVLELNLALDAVQNGGSAQS